MSSTVHLSARAPRLRRAAGVLALVPAALALAACGIGPSAAADGDAGADASEHHAHGSGTDAVSAAMLATAAYQDVEVAEAAGYASSLQTLGCFQNPEAGGMGVHYIDESVLDAEVDVGHPEALVYELDANREIVGLVAHEYIVPVEAWTSKRPPRLFGMAFHRHPVLPLWVLHVWLWKDNPGGLYADWNPAVRQCPAGVPVFGRDLPAD
jgi:hypothetical protein